MKLRWGGVVAAVLGTVATPQEADAFFGRRCAPQPVCQPVPVCQPGQAIQPGQAMQPAPPGYRWVTRMVTKTVPRVVIGPDGRPVTVTESQVVPETTLEPILSAQDVESLLNRIAELEKAVGPNPPGANPVRTEIEEIKKKLKP